MEKRVLELEEEVKRLRDELMINVKTQNYLQNEQLTSSKVAVDDNSVEEIEIKIQESQETTGPSSMSLLPVEVQLMILKNLDFKSLKNARAVSQSWNSQATRILSNCSEINLNNFFELGKSVSTDKWAFPEKITPGLIKFIHAPKNSTNDNKVVDMQEMINKNKINNNNITRWTQLIKFCKKYSEDIIGIVANGEGYDYRKVLQFVKTVLVKCEKLQNLTLYRLQHDNDVERKPRKFMKFFPKPLSLKFIQLDFYFEWEIEICEHFLDKLFKASENLEELKISGPMECYSPNLSNNKKLKRLQIYPDYDMIDIMGINQMIEQTSSSLETLKFLEPDFGDDDDDDDLDNADLSFPSSMSQLKVFINEDLRTFPMDSCTPLLLNSENLQTLHLTTAKSHPKSMITESFFDGVTTHLKLENLKIAEIEDDSILVTICKIFPNLKKIDFSVGKVRISNGVTVELEKFIINCLEICCSNTKLVDITITMQLYYDLFEITEILLESSGKLFSGDRTLTFANGWEFGCFAFKTLPNGTDVTDEEILKFQNSILLTRGLKRFQLKRFQIDATAVLKIAEFITKNNLPVRFID